MDLTKTSPTPEPPPESRDAGLTLVEMLAALAVAATVTSFVALSLGGTREARMLDKAVSHLAGDLRSARTAARSRGADIELSVIDGGYAIDALGIQHQWPSGVQVSWQDAAQSGGPLERFVFTPTRLSQAGLTIEIGEGDRSRTLVVEAITGRIDAP